MIRSMTAYAYREIKDNWGNAIWELRSVNHRYLEICIFLPCQFRIFEPVIRERIRSRLKRGKIECSLRFKKNFIAQTEFTLNKDLIKSLFNAINWIKKQDDIDKINPIDVLNWPGAITSKEDDYDKIFSEILIIFNKTLEDFIEVREAEGERIQFLIEQRLEKISREVEKVRTYIPKVLQWQQERLISKLKNIEIYLEHNRLEQELVLMAQRIDVTEELDRLEMHVKETFKTLKKEEAIGRRLDFIMQEFNRESNTLSSKSISSNITLSAIEMKILIEQIREQIQNIE